MSACNVRIRAAHEAKWIFQPLDDSKSKIFKLFTSYLNYSLEAGIFHELSLSHGRNFTKHQISSH